MECNWGVLGPGFVASKAVIPAIQRSWNGRVYALASRDPARAETVAGEWHIERVYDTYQALLADPAIDAVYIALPNHLHCTWTIQAARAGKHVLCEKPLARTASEGAQMVAACQQAGVQLMEAAMYRFHPRLQHLHQLVNDGSLGELRFLHSSFTFTLDDPKNYRLVPAYGGGALLDVGYYCVNALCWLNGSPPGEVQSRVYQREAGGVDLATTAQLRFGQDTWGHLQCSFGAAEHQVLEVVGSQGTATAALAFTAWRNDPTELHLRYGSHALSERFAPVDPYQLMVEHFVSALTGETSLAYAPEQAVHVLNVLDAIRDHGGDRQLQ
jgi:xylose dehydrogenase (NAD/NADP)